jgi:hypothetical protein
MNFSFTTMATSPSDLVFQFKPNMNHEDMFKELHTKTHTCALSSTLTIQAIICVTMEYEVICSTTRAVAAQSHVTYVPHTMTDYLDLIDRPAYLAHVTVVGVAVAGRYALTATVSYSETLADAHDQIQNSFNRHIADKRWDVIHTGTGATTLNKAQTDKVASSIVTLMQDCKTHLDNALYTEISTPDMSAYHYLTSLDFVKDDSGCKTHFGRIPHTYVRFPHL